ncbi:MAG: transglutaminase family protein [Breznakibacter sp.]
MQLRIVHETSYRFSDVVFIEPHTLRFHPGVKPFLRTKSFVLDMDPVPAGLVPYTDPEGNIVHNCWFNGLHNKLTIKCRIDIETSETNPYHFIINPARYVNLPFEYYPSDRDLLAPALTYGALDENLIRYAEQILADAGYETVPFVSLLTQSIHADFKKTVRLEGPPHNANTTFNSKQGACRDLAWMQIQMFRKLGIASRFVSGYYYLPDLSSPFELHAWVEVFLPGAGWIGVDPSYGLLTGADHFALAHSAYSEHTMTVSGTILGNAKSTLSTYLSIVPVR